MLLKNKGFPTLVCQKETSAAAFVLVVPEQIAVQVFGRNHIQKDGS